MLPKLVVYYKREGEASFAVHSTEHSLCGVYAGTLGLALSVWTTANWELEAAKTPRVTMNSEGERGAFGMRWFLRGTVCVTPRIPTPTAWPGVHVDTLLCAYAQAVVHAMREDLSVLLSLSFHFF